MVLLIIINNGKGVVDLSPRKNNDDTNEGTGHLSQIIKPWGGPTVHQNYKLGILVK